MQIKNNIKKSETVAKVLFSMQNPKIYVGVSDIALFLNVLFGTHTITGQKVNEMLEITGYQRTKTEEELQRDDLIDIKYIALKKAKNLFIVDKLIRNGTEVYRLVWNASILLDIFNINIEDKDFEIAGTFYNGVYKYNLINKSNEDVDYDVLEENVDYIKEELEKEKAKK